MTATVLVYGDSMSWGIIPGSRNRQPFSQRWPGVMQQQLEGKVRVIEECLNGRTTIFEDPNRPARQGLNHLPMLMASHSPVDLLVIMLGINDFQDVIGATASESAAGLRQLVETALAQQPEPMPAPARVLVVIPPQIQQPKAAMAEKFSGFRRGEGSEQTYLNALAGLPVEIVQASTATGLSTVDGVHLDTDQHQALGTALARVVETLLG